LFTGTPEHHNSTFSFCLCEGEYTDFSTIPGLPRDYAGTEIATFKKLSQSLTQLFGKPLDLLKKTVEQCPGIPYFYFSKHRFSPY